MSKLKVGFLTTFNAPCGIADYARNLAREIRILGNDVVVLGNLPYGSGEVDNVNEFEVHKVFEVEIHTGKQFFDFEMIYGIIDKIDVLHIQFESAIYTRSLLSTLLKEIKGKIPIVVTIHSSCNWLDSDFDAITTPVKKLAEMNNFIWIPHGIPEFPKIERPIDLVVSSIGLGRNMDDIVVNTIKQIESDIGRKIEFITSYGHHKWLTQNELFEFLKKSRVVSLYYPPVDALVSSSACALSLGSYRPVIVSETNWFGEYDSNIVLRSNAENLYNNIKKALLEDYNAENVDKLKKTRAWNVLAKQYNDVYEIIG